MYAKLENLTVLNDYVLDQKLRSEVLIERDYINKSLILLRSDLNLEKFPRKINGR